METKIKRVIDKIYSFDFSNNILYNGKEIIVENGISEFDRVFSRQNLEKSLIVKTAYTNGLFYKSTNGGEIFSSLKFLPDILNFGLSFYGLKKGSFYRITVIGRNAGLSTFITSNRKLVVTNNYNELILEEDFTNVHENSPVTSIFRSNSTEMTLSFRMGKIFINDIIIEEVELIKDKEEKYEEELKEVEYSSGKTNLAAFGVFSTESVESEFKHGRYLEMTKYAGNGINLYFDNETNQYFIERDNTSDILGESFTNLRYVVDINFNKVVNKGFFSQYNICEVSDDISPNTLKQGFIRFEFVDANDEPVKYSGKNSRLGIYIYKIN